MEKISASSLKKMINKVDSNLNLDEELTKLSKKPLLKGISVDYSNYNMLLDYVTSVDNCKTCKGLKFCKNTNPYYSIRLETSPVSIVSYPCKYYKEELERKSKQSNFSTLFIPDSLKEASFDELYETSEARIKAKKYVMNLATSFATIKPRKGLYLFGNFQIGKTYFLAAAANYLASVGIESLLIYFPDLVRVLKSLSFSDKVAFEEKINYLKKVPVLMLDDLGAELNSEWVRDEILGPVLNYRIQENLPLFISSNLDMKELNNHYAEIDNNINNATRLVWRIKASSTYTEYK